mgnify:CR=1 FL=1
MPETIECFDISNIQGSDVVASMVVFEEGLPKKSDYRHMRIQGDWGNDDYASMHEAVTRWFRRRRDEERPIPDFCLIDGGKGQLGAARQALEGLELLRGRQDQLVAAIGSAGTCRYHQHE